MKQEWGYEAYKGLDYKEKRWSNLDYTNVKIHGATLLDKESISGSLYHTKG